jgi:5-methylcytosine-specific restriction protein A
MNTGRDWTYEECVAGLWAFKETQGKAVSKLPESPVSRVSLDIGRVVSGVYNKVMNFRSIDPSDSRKGFSSTNHIDHQAWSDFFIPETKMLDSMALDKAYHKYWGNSLGDHASTLLDNEPSGTASYSWTIRDNNSAFKSLDKSTFLHRGTAIPIEIRHFFINGEMQSGQRIPVSLVCGGKTFDAHIEMDSQDIPRTRLFWSSGFSKELRSLFPHHYHQYVGGLNEDLSELIMGFNRVTGFEEYHITFTGEIRPDSIQQDILAEEVEDDGPPSKEGAAKEYYGKRYERDPANRKKAIKIHGLTCKICNFNFEENYGERGADFIEVHHCKPIYTFGGQAQTVDPRTDLVPVCSNCHRMIHRRSDQILTIEKLKDMYLQLKKARESDA